MLTYNARFLLKCVVRFSANKSSVESARRLLMAAAKVDEKEFAKEKAMAGGFTLACLGGDVIEAWQRGDEHNRLALELGMSDFFATKGKMWNAGLDPADPMLRARE